VGCILGIGLYKGARNINFKVLGEIGLAWIISPVASGLLTFFLLFFMKNIFGIYVGTKAGQIVNDGIQTATIAGGTDLSGIIKYTLLGVLIFGSIAIGYYLLLQRRKKLGFQKSEERFWMNMK
jgi:hypothetical protein